MALANYIRTTGSGSNWYEVKISDLTAELLEYFTLRAERDTRYTVFTDKTVQWSTQFEFADQLDISIELTKEGLPRLACSAILSLADRRALANEARKSLNNRPATVAVSASAKISINPDDAEF